MSTMSVNVNGIIEQREVDHVRVFISDGDDYKIVARLKFPTLYELEICNHDADGNCFVHSPVCFLGDNCEQQS